MAEVEQRFCKDCHHYVFNARAKYMQKYGSDDPMVTVEHQCRARVSLVTGARLTLDAELERGPTGRCGPTAVNFMEKVEEIH